MAAHSSIRLSGDAGERPTGVTHCQPHTLELCPRLVVLSEGVIAADGPKGGIVADEELMARHRLELPFGFVPSSAA